MSRPDPEHGKLEEKCVANRDSVANCAFSSGQATRTSRASSGRSRQNRGDQSLHGILHRKHVGDEEEVLEKIFRHAPATIATHCDTPTILRNEEEARRKFGVKFPFPSTRKSVRAKPACGPRAWRSNWREEARLHVLHITTAEELLLFEPGRERIPRRLAYIICGSSNRAMKPRLPLKCNPAIKSIDRRRSAKRWPTEPFRSCDRSCPTHLGGKQGNYFQAPAGLPLAQHSLLLMLEMAKKDASRSKQWSNGLAMLQPDFRLRDRGFLLEGY